MFDWFKGAFRKRKVPSEEVVAAAVAFPINRDMADPSVYKPFADAIAALLTECHKEGLLIYAFEANRSDERQAQLYAQGRTTPGIKVTNADAGLSFHNYGLAVDLVFDNDAAKPGYQWTWNGNYGLLGKIIKAQFSDKLSWAGDWTSFPEYPHVQWKTAVTVHELKAAKAAKGLAGAWELLSTVKKPAAKKKPAVKKVKAPAPLVTPLTPKPKTKKKAPAKKKV